jgi:subunit length determinant Wzz-like protein
LEDEISLLEILNVLLKRWRAVIAFLVSAAVVALGISFLVSPTYSATTSFVPEVRSQGLNESGLPGWFERAWRAGMAEGLAESCRTGEWLPWRKMCPTSSAAGLK